MAEFVELRMEDTIREVEEMERLGILSNKEVKKLTQKRKDCLYRLARNSKRKIDFINYVDYEKKLLELIKIRRKKIGVYEKRNQIETPIMRRAVKQTKVLTSLWPAHLDTWALRIGFASYIGWKQEISSAYTLQINFHGNNESLWVAWAKWEVEERRNFDKARDILLSRASVYHPKSQLIKRELFRLELLFIEMLMNRQKYDNIAGLEEVIAENREKVLNCAVARAVYVDAVRTLPEPELYLQMYQVANKFKFAHNLRDEIYRDLCMKFPSAECLWKLKAQRLVSGLSEAQIALMNATNTTKDNSEAGKEDGGERPEEEEENENDEETSQKEEGEGSDGQLEMIPLQNAERSKASQDSVNAVKGKGATSDPSHGEAAHSKEDKDDMKPDASIPSASSPTSSAKLDPKGKLDVLISTFNKAMEVVGVKFATTYIDELVSLLHQCWGKTDMATLVQNTLLKLFEQHTNLLSPLHFYIWYQVLNQLVEDKHKARTVLEKAVQQHPDATHLHLDLVKCMIKDADTDAQVWKEIKNIGSSLHGECGLAAWKEFAKHLCKDNNKTKLFKAAMDHEDQTVARGMRILYLQDVGLMEDIRSARKLYQKLKWRPPFCGRLHAQMVEMELAQGAVNVEAVREVFTVSVQQQGATNPGMWLSYVYFEKKHGDPLKTGGLLTRAEKELEAQQSRVFRELNMTVKELQNKGEEPTGSESSNKIFIEEAEEEQTQSTEDAEPQPALVSLFEEELTLSYAANNARNAFFTAIHAMERNIKKGNKPTSSKNKGEWEKVLELLVGHKILLNIQEVKVERESGETNKDEDGKDKLIAPRFMKKYKPTDHLDPGEQHTSKIVNEDDIEKILASSEVLKPDFMQKTSLAPYFVSKKKAKAIRKKESAKTKGPGWFNMKVPELTEELKRDLEVLQMRSVLDPKRHYKNDMKVLPKAFQIAEVVDSPVDFYSSRVPKKSRKRTMVEEIMQDEEALRYQKKKYNDIIASKQKKQFKNPNVLKKKKKKSVPKKK